MNVQNQDVDGCTKTGLLFVVFATGNMASAYMVIAKIAHAQDAQFVVERILIKIMRKTMIK